MLENMPNIKTLYLMPFYAYYFGIINISLQRCTNFNLLKQLLEKQKDNYSKEQNAGKIGANLNKYNWLVAIAVLKIKYLYQYMYNGKEQGSPPNCLFYVTNQIELIYFNRTVSTPRSGPKCCLTCLHNFKNYKLPVF